MSNRKGAYYALAVLFAINTMNFYDRQILGAVGELVKADFNLGDTGLGFLGTAFIILYAVIGVPLGRLTDKTNRTRILIGGVFVWSLFTAASGLATRYWQLFALRLGVGVGEATCAPASSSLVGDMFPATKRAKAMAIFMLGLPIGIALSYLVSSQIASVSKQWRPAFYIAIIPGLLCVVAIYFMREPERGATETHSIGGLKREGSPYKLVLATPTMWWIILSGALHNFNMYAIGGFLSPLMMRYHGAGLSKAGIVAMIVNGLSGIPGLALGGIIGDAIMRRWRNGRLVVATIAILLSVPLFFFALGRPKDDLMGFAIPMGMGVMLIYSYYSTVYATVQDVIEPSLRGTAMALYFFAMYALGAAIGPVGIGLLSDHYGNRFAMTTYNIPLVQLRDDVRNLKEADEQGGLPTDRLREIVARHNLSEPQPGSPLKPLREAIESKLKPAEAEGLHSAYYVIPIINIFLTLALFAGSRTVTKDMEKLQRWMRESAGKAGVAEAVKVEAVK